MSLKQRIEEILRKFERYLEWKHRVVPCITTSDKVELPGIDYLDIDQATADILKVIELDEEKIAKFMLDYDFEGTNNSFPSKSLVETYRRYVKAIAQGDVYKEER